MRSTRYLVTEACFHASYLVGNLHHLSGHVKALVRDNLALDKQKLFSAHAVLAGKKDLTREEVCYLEEAYKSKLSRSERALIAMHGVPEKHVLSLPDTQCVTSLNSTELLNALELESRQYDLCAGIFLDCILKPRWLEIFEQRIVNAHSAILPHARGMHAIEQIAAAGDPSRMETCAGATIHYIDEKVDMGSLIRTRQLPDLWQLETIWQVKAQSYMTAFSLLTEYLSSLESFKRKDGHPYEHAIGPEFKLKDFTPEVAARAESAFIKMKATQCQEEVRTVISNKF